jgi:hypothetical protein
MIILHNECRFRCGGGEGTPDLVGLPVSRITNSEAGALTAVDVKNFAGHEGGRFEVKDAIKGRLTLLELVASTAFTRR